MPLLSIPTLPLSFLFFFCGPCARARIRPPPSSALSPPQRLPCLTLHPSPFGAPAPPSAGGGCSSYLTHCLWPAYAVEALVLTAAPRFLTLLLAPSSCAAAAAFGRKSPRPCPPPPVPFSSNKHLAQFCGRRLFNRRRAAPGHIGPGRLSSASPPPPHPSSAASPPFPLWPIGPALWPPTRAAGTPFSALFPSSSSPQREEAFVLL